MNCQSAWGTLITVGLMLAGAGTARAQFSAVALGVALQRPTVQAEAFLEDVRALRDADDIDAGPGAVGRLAKEARTLRDLERHDYDNVGRVLQGMGAPDKIYGWAHGISQLLSQPQIVSKEAQPYVQNDPDTATVLATIDEAQAVKIIAERNTETTETWLKVTGGAAGVWGVTLGRLTAGMQVAAQSGHAFLLPRQSVLTLHDTAPAGTPPLVVRTLAELAPRGRGNLSALVHLPSATLPAAKAGPPAQAILSAYGLK